MFEELFSKTYYGNTVGNWVLVFGITIGSIVIAKFLYWASSTVVKKITSKTKTKLDDIIVDKVEEPLVFALIIGGIWYATTFLNKSEMVDIYLHKIYYILIIGNVAWMVVRLFDAVIEEYLVPIVEKSESQLDDQLLPIVRKAIKLAIWVVAIILALNNAGYDVGTLLAGLGIGGLAFALAAQDTVKNLFGGFTIFVDKPFSVKDRVKVAGFEGNVEEIGIRSLRLRTLDGRMVVIPNSDVANRAIENVTSEPSRKIIMKLGLTYSTTEAQIQQAIGLLKEIAENNSLLVDADLSREDEKKGVKPSKKIVAIFEGFGDFSLNLLFVYFIKAGEDYFAVQNDINFKILSEFNKNKLNFAYPTQTIFTEKVVATT